MAIKKLLRLLENRIYFVFWGWTNVYMFRSGKEALVLVLQFFMLLPNAVPSPVFLSLCSCAIFCTQAHPQHKIQVL